MTLWFLFALMTAAAVLAVLWPLRSGKTPPAAGNDLAVYRDQLDEIERDHAAGMIGAAEAEAARVEVSRRLLVAADTAEAASKTPPAGSLMRRRATALAALIILPLGAGLGYIALGSPGLPGQPLAERNDPSLQNRSIASLVAQVEGHLERNPEDGRGWEVVAPVYMRLGRYDDAVKARRNALRILGTNAEREADYGEALVGAANGIVTADARAAFERAMKHDSDHVRARFYVGLAAEQDGNRDQAAKIFRELLARAPPGASWVPFVRAALARVGGADVAASSAPNAVEPKAAPGPTTEDVAAAAQMSEGDRGEMIRGMVARLAERLKNDGSDPDGWLRLVRAYMVLGDRDKARAAAGDARRALTNEPDKLRRLEDGVKQLGLEG
jgi:cytochrome c-type biogenesis protein CcmH